MHPCRPGHNDTGGRVARHDRTLTFIMGAAMTASTLLTGQAFWLSYQHLEELAATHGLGRNTPRSWAWPAGIDLFIVIGELLCLRAAILRQVDAWAIGLLAFGGGSSIALNVVAVGSDRPPLDYIVAAVPSIAALLGFGVIMQAVHRAVAKAISEQDEQADHPVYDQPEQPATHTEYPASTPIEQPTQPPIIPAQPTEQPEHRGLSSLPADLISTAEAMNLLGVARATFGRYTREQADQPARLTAITTDANGRKYYSRAHVEALKAS